MDTANLAEPLDEQNRKLRARISELEKEAADHRRFRENAIQTQADATTAALSYLMDDAPIGFVFYDANLLCRAVNKHYVAMSGIPVREYFGCAVEEIVPHMAGRIRQVFREVLESRVPFLDYESSHGMNETTGQVRYWSEKWYPVTTPDATLLGVCCLVVDITERKGTEEALRVSQQRLELAQSAAGIATYDWDLRANVGHGSREFNPLYGLPPGDIGPSFEEWLAIIHPEDRARVREERMRSLDGGDPCNNEFRVVWPDGTIHWLFAKGKLMRDSEGNPIRMVGVNMDITERKLVETARRDNEERLHAMANSTSVMICASGPDKLATFFNKGWLDFTGRPLEQELGYGWTTGIHPDDRDRCLASYSASFDARRFCHLEYRLRRADGEYRWVLCNGVPHYAPAGAFAGYIASCMDITDLKRNQEEVLARQKLESLGVLAGGIAHDFNNLLGSILAESELILESSADRSTALEGVRSIKSVAVRAAEIVRELMAFAGQENELFELVDISSLVSEMLQLLKVSISKRAVLNVDLPSGLPAVRAHAAQIRQVVMNLITNASEALGENEGVISVTVADTRLTQESPAADASRLASNDYLRLTVTDTGCGMTQDIKAKIFDPFFTTKFAGRGLGLAAVQGIIRDHGGTINVASAPGQGSRFEILLPCTGQPAQHTRQLGEPTSRKAGSTPGTVLVVEDEEVLRVVVSKVLRDRGFSVIEASDGRTGADLFQSNQSEVNVVLLDMTLPRMSGREVLVELRRIRPDVKVILTTAYSEDSVLLSLGEQRPWHFLRKPYHLGDLVELVRDAVG